MLIFHRPEFLRGMMKIKDVKLNEQGNPLKDDKGKSCFVFWHLTPDMRGKSIKFNDENFVKSQYPHLFFKSQKDIDSFLEKRKKAIMTRNAVKATARQKELEGDVSEAIKLKEGWLEKEAKENLEKFKKERLRFNR